MNTIRLWMFFAAFIGGGIENQNRVAAYFDTALQIADKHGLKVIPTSFNGWRSVPDFGGFAQEMVKNWMDDRYPTVPRGKGSYFPKEVLTMDLGIGGKTAIVTGGGSGIGKAICFALAQEGAQVVVADIHKDRAEAVATEIAKRNEKAIGVAADVSSTSDVNRMLSRVIEEWGRVDILVNNAGIILQAQTVDMTEQQWNKILTNNLSSCFLCSQAAARQMIKQGGGGRIVNISSIHAELSEPSAGAYTAAKGGMEAFARTLATELAPHKITVNCVRPGATYTELTVPMYTEQVKKALFTRIPLREIADPAWIADGVVFLASDRARYITGQILAIDGGYLMDGSLPGAEYWK